MKKTNAKKLILKWGVFSVTCALAVTAQETLATSFAVYDAASNAMRIDNSTDLIATFNIGENYAFSKDSLPSLIATGGVISTNGTRSFDFQNALIDYSVANKGGVHANKNVKVCYDLSTKLELHKHSLGMKYYGWGVHSIVSDPNLFLYKLTDYLALAFYINRSGLNWWGVNNNRDEITHISNQCDNIGSERMTLYPFLFVYRLPDSQESSLEIPSEITIGEVRITPATAPRLGNNDVAVPFKGGASKLKLRFSRTSINLKTKTCNINPASIDQHIHLAKVPKQRFPNKGDTSPAGNFAISLICNDNVVPWVSFSDSNYLANPEQSVPASRNYLSLSSDSTARGVGLQITPSNSTAPLVFHQQSALYISDNIRNADPNQYGNQGGRTYNENNGWIKFVDNTANNRNPTVNFDVKYYNIAGNVHEGIVKGRMTYTFSYQ